MAQAAATQELKNSIQTKLESTGEYDRLKEHLRQKLIESGWRDQLKEYTMTLIRNKEDQQMTVEQLTAEIIPRGRGTVPDDIKAELLTRIRKFAESQA